MMRGLFRTTNPLPNFPPRYNIAPTQDVLAVRFNPETHERSLDPLRWGLIPHWAKDATIGNKLINARAESIADKPAFKQAFAKRRCLIPADAFYEWKKGTKPKQPYLIRMADRHPFAFAGLWENWKNPDGQWIRTCTIITTTANELVAPIHDRMPVILPPESYANWLGEQPGDEADLFAILKPYPAEKMQLHAVGAAVNSVGNDDPSLLEMAGSAYRVQEMRFCTYPLTH